MVTTVEMQVASNLGMVAMVYHISKKNRFPRKRYMGVWSVESVRIIKMMRVFPVRESRYRVRKMTKSVSRREGEPENPRRMNSVTAVRFAPSITHLL